MKNNHKLKLLILITSMIIIYLITYFYFRNFSTKKDLTYDENGYIEFQENVKISDISSFDKIDDVAKRVSYNDFIKNLNDKNVSEVYAEFQNEKYNDNIYFFMNNDNTCYVVDNSFADNFKKDILEHDAKVYGKEHIFERLGITTDFSPTNVIQILINLLSLSVTCLMLFYIAKMVNSASTKNDSKVEVNNMKNSKTFADIGGHKELKKDLMCLVDFIKNNDKYKESGAKLPSGVLLVGPPGTGKTVLAKAIAKEASVNFYSASGSDFVEMFVGRGAARIRELFKTARKNTPCIIFIDELDTLCAKRSDTSGHSEDRKTLTALLTEMDGFKTDSGILVIGATNRMEDIDDAVLRPGRFTEIYHVPNPQTVEERMEIIDIYRKDKKFSEDVDFHAFAKEMIGRSPAEIEAVLNESAIISVQKGLSYINKTCIDEAVYKRLMKGHQKDNKETNIDDLKTVAFHEAGHALVAKLNRHSVSKVTILPSTSGAGGVTFIQPDERNLYTKKMLEEKVCEMYGGAVAEYLSNGCDWNLVTTGCSNDIEQATLILKNMMNKYGMSNKGLLNMEVLNKNIKEITEDVYKLSEELKNRTIELLKENYDKLETLAMALLEKETLHENEIDEILNIKVA